MKSIIIYNTRSGNTEELGNKMKDILEKYGHECDIYRDKNIKVQIKKQQDFFNSYDLVCFGSCTHFWAPAIMFKLFLKIIRKQNLKNKKLICFASSGDIKSWVKTCKKIQKKFTQLEHIGNIGCSYRENEETIKNFDEIIKNLS